MSELQGRKNRIAGRSADSRQGSRFSVQIILIYVIILAALIGSGLFFAYLNTNSIRKSVEMETRLSSELLAANLHTDADDQAGEDIDVWIVDRDGRISYKSAGASDRVVGNLIPADRWRVLLNTLDEPSDVFQLWIGDDNPFLFKQSMCVIRPSAEDGLFLVIYNHCTTIIAHQRQQITLFAGIELVLILVILMLLTNMIFSYRRKIVQLATMDELTGLANRKSFRVSFMEFRKNSQNNSKERFSLFLMDIDFFKQVNDTYGHSAGDLAIRTLADRLKAMVDGQNGFAGRWGGDEFIGILPMTAQKAQKVLSELCGKIPVGTGENEFFITISAGIVESDGSTRLSHLTEQADLALYASKENGRNQVSLYTADLIRTEQAVQGEQGRLSEEKTAAFAAGSKTGSESEAKYASVLETAASTKKKSAGERLKGYLREKLFASTLLGVKWMAPFIAGGGILIGIAFLFDASAVDMASLTLTERTGLGSITPQAAVLKSIGDSTFNFMLPVFAGFMAYGIAGETAFLAGFVGGFMTIQTNSGFIGAMLAGFVAGVLASEMNQFIGRLPKIIQKAAPIIIFPVMSLLLMQVVASFIIAPISGVVGDFFRMLLELAMDTNANLANTLAGGMMAMDMGGIINKVAYNYGVEGLAIGRTAFMASVMAGGMVPPIGVAISMWLFRRKYTQAERDSGVGTLFMGLSFITEGVLPFVFTDVKRVIPACIAGSALAGLLSSVFGCTLPAPHGGIFVIPVMHRPFLYLAAIAAGSLLTAVILGRWKKEAVQDADL